jgi:hypothetical protein
VRLSLLGRFHEVDEPLFLARRHASQSMAFTDRADLRSRLARYLGAGPLPPPEWWDASQAGRVTFPDWNLLRQYVASVRDAPLSAAERARCRLAIARWLLRYWPKLARDVVFAGERLLTRYRAADPAPYAPTGGARADAESEDDDDEAATHVVERTT